MRLRLRSAAGPVKCAPHPGTISQRTPAATKALTYGNTTKESIISEVACELATNALKASQSLPEIRPFALCLRSDRKRLLIEVWDHSPREPRSALAGGDAEGGRGLLVVEALSARWGYQRTGYSTKVVWAELGNPEG